VARWSDARSPEAAAYRKLYQSKEWKDFRAGYLQHHPWCVKCEARGERVRAAVVDHVNPHRGDVRLFWKGPFQGLCHPHHSGAKQREEARGYAMGSDAGGRPLDPHHPWNRR
jgi:hypothetical protein